MAATADETSFILKMGYVKDLAEFDRLTTLPSHYAYSSSTVRSSEDEDSQVEAEEQIPTIDFSLLTSPSPDIRSKTVGELARACEDWGFFLVMNHGLPEGLIEKMLDVCGEFFNQTEEEKLKCAGKSVLDPIRCGTSFNASKDEVFFWRDYLKVMVHPQFHSPPKPVGFREISFEYCQRTRQVARELLKGISESLGLEKNYIDEAMELDSCFQILTGNLYPPCPQPELAMGLPPHSDHGLLTLLIQNQNGGLQIKHNGKWINVGSSPNSFLVNIGDQLEIVSNGKYKSVLHQAIVNNRATRISIATTHGPRFDKLVAPALELVDNENSQAKYHGMTYREYLELQQGNRLDGKSCVDRIRV